MEVQKLTAGRFVQVGIGLDPDGRVVYRPAIVVQDWGNGVHPNVQVFLDGSNDARYRERARGDYDEFVKAHPAVNTGAEIGDAAAVQRLCDLSNALNYSPTAEECAHGFAWRTSVDEGEGVYRWRWPPRT